MKLVPKILKGYKKYSYNTILKVIRHFYIKVFYSYTSFITNVVTNEIMLVFALFQFDTKGYVEDQSN